MTHEPAALTDAEASLAAGHLEDAAQGLEGYLRGEGIPKELRSRALLALGRAYGRAGRFFEAAVVGRRLVDLERSRGEEGDLPTALALLAVALLNAKAPTRAEPVVAELEERLQGVPPRAAPQLHRVLNQARYSLALIAQDVAEAERRIGLIRAMVAEGILGPEEGWFLKNGEFHLAMARRDVVAMDALLREILSGSGAQNVYVPELTIRVGLAIAHAEHGNLEAARLHAFAAAGALAGIPPGSEVVMDEGAALVRVLHDRLGETNAALRAAEHVTASFLERVRLVQESAATLQALAKDVGEAAGTQLREDCRDTLLAFLDEVRRMIPHVVEAREHGGPGVLPICSWCGSVRLAPGQWVALDRFLPKRSVGGVTHGICPLCRHTVLGG